MTKLIAFLLFLPTLLFGASIPFSGLQPDQFGSNVSTGKIWVKSGYATTNAAIVGATVYGDGPRTNAVFIGPSGLTVSNAVGTTLITLPNGNNGMGTDTPGANLDISTLGNVIANLWLTPFKSALSNDFNWRFTARNAGLDYRFDIACGANPPYFSILNASMGAPGGRVGVGIVLPTSTFHVVGDSNIRTNVAQFDVSVTDFVIGTRYTNVTRRSFVAASFQLTAAVAGTAAVTLNVEQAGVTNKLTISSGPLAGLTTIEPLTLLVGPGAFYTFTDATSGAGASVAIVAGTSSRTDF